MGYKNKGFTLIELLVTMVIISVLSGTSVPIMSKFNAKAADAYREAVIRNISLIIKADEFTSDGVNFADIDEDGIWGAGDLVTVADIKFNLDRQDYILPESEANTCYLYGYGSVAGNKDEFLFVVNRKEETGAGTLGFIFDGSDDAVAEGANLTAITCAGGSEGVTGGTWTNYRWLNLVP